MDLLLKKGAKIDSNCMNHALQENFRYLTFEPVQFNYSCVIDYANRVSSIDMFQLHCEIIGSKPTVA